MAGIDRDYWLNFAKERVTNGIESRDNAADKLDVFLGWIWVVYTTIFAVGSLLDSISSNILQLIWLAQPIVIIMLSRLYCTLVSLPNTSSEQSLSADPNNVPSIIDSFKFIVNEKRKKLRNAKILSVISTISIAVSLVGYNSCDQDKAIKQEIQTAKLKKDLIAQQQQKEQQIINDSIKLVNDFYAFQAQNIVKKRLLDCIKNNREGCDQIMKLLQD